jgi:AbrB family looped-hinge helix DNA binding protein
VELCDTLGVERPRPAAAGGRVAEGSAYQFEFPITRKGQITVPKAVREALGVTPGDRLAFHVHEDGRVTVEAETVDLRALRGIIRPAVRGITVEQMNEAIRQAAARR